MLKDNEPALKEVEEVIKIAKALKKRRSQVQKPIWRLQLGSKEKE